MKKRKPNRGRSGNPAKQKQQARAPGQLPAASSPIAAKRPTRNVQFSGLARLWTPSAATPAPRAQANVGTAATRTTALSRDDRQSLALMLAPFLIVAASLASQQILRTSPVRSPEPASTTQAANPSAAITAPSPTVPFDSRGLIPPGATPAERTTVTIRRAPPATIMEQPRVASLERPIVPELRPAPSLAPTEVPMPPIELPELAFLPLPAVAPVELPALALLAPTPMPALQPAPVIASPVRPVYPPAEVCAAQHGLFDRTPAPRATAPTNPREFGLALGAAARAQTSEVTIYNAKYQRIAYPMGDVSKLYGVCTDVVVRAYRELGVDLQELIVTTRSGRGDAHIDHRRVEVVRQFLAKHGASLPITDFAEDYQPGDVVTYYRPQNRTTTSHVAVVTDQPAPSGRYLIAHNRGWGAQLEDALFVDKITGHYRFMGLATPAKAAQTASSTGARQPPLTKVATGERNRTTAGRATAKR